MCLCTWLSTNYPKHLDKEMFLSTLLINNRLVCGGHTGDCYLVQLSILAPSQTLNDALVIKLLKPVSFVMIMNLNRLY